MCHCIGIFVAFLLSYLIGSIPFGYLMGKFIKGIDIRRLGSGNLGATNVIRVLGPGPGFLTLFLDGGKGLFCVIVLAPLLIHQAPYFTVLQVLCGVAAVFGHNWTCFLSFKGGKGVATSTGVFLGIVPWAVLSSMVLWLITILIWRYVSVSSIVAAISFPIFLILWKSPLEIIIVGFFISVIGIWKHQSNIKRLMEGTEPKISRGKVN